MSLDSKSPSISIQFNKKHIVTIIGGILAAIITAATPGFLSWLENAGERARDSQETAQRADLKSAMAYEETWRHVQFLQKRVDDNHSDIVNLTQRIDMLIMLYKGQTASSPSRPSRDRFPTSVDYDDLDSLLGTVSGLEGGSGGGGGVGTGARGTELGTVEGACDEDTDSVISITENVVQNQTQQMLKPADLDSLVNDRIKEGKNDE